jgi:poly(3-hydroxybutyrate) depolymerase
MMYAGDARVVYVTFKGAGHMVPQTKRAEAYNLFKKTLDGQLGFKNKP